MVAAAPRRYHRYMSDRRDLVRMFIIALVIGAMALTSCRREPAADGDSNPPRETQPKPKNQPDGEAVNGREGLPPLDLRTARLVDLTHALDRQTLYWPTSSSAFELTQLYAGMTEGGYYYSANSFCTPEHGGTHLDAPIHFAEGAYSAEQVPLERLVGPAVVIDVSSQANGNKDYRLTAADVASWERANGRIPDGAIVLMRTGWSDKWPDRLAYFGDDKPGDASNLHFPSYGADAAAVLVKERRVAALGLDTPSIDYGPSSDFPVHRLVGEANVSGLENLTNLDKVPASGAWVAALPVKIAGGSGGPARVIAFVPPAP